MSSKNGSHLAVCGILVVLNIDVASTVAMMKQIRLHAVLYASALLSLVTAKALLAVFDDLVVLEQTYPVEWLSDEADVSQQ